MLIRLLPLFFVVAAFAVAADEPTAESKPLVAQELAQGFRSHVLLAKPRAAHRATVDGAEAREGVRTRQRFSRLGDLRVIELDDSENLDAVHARLKATDRYEFVERDLIRHIDATPNDASFATQWQMSNNGGSGGLAGADIKALAAWDVLHDAPNVIVAVVDTGLNLNHPDIIANLWTNPSLTAGINDLHGADFVGGRGRAVSGNPADTDGHGTHVAGIIGAVGNNGLNVAGVAWRVQIMPLRALGTSGGTISDIAAAINYAIAHGASIINASFGEAGGSGFSQTELAAVTAARDAGVIFVAAAGNDTADMSISPHYPASHALDNIVSVGSSNRNDFVSSFSNYGAAIDLFAPGESILSLDFASTSVTGTTTKSGTSMAAPHVAGALALIKAQFPTDSYRQLINRLLRTTDPGDKFTGKAQTNGRMNLLKALTSTSNTPFNDNFSSRALLVGSNLVARANNTGATLDPSEPSHAGQGGAASLWWEWTAPATGAVSVDTSGSVYDTLLAIYTGTSLGGLTAVASNDDDGTTPTSRLKFTAQAGVTYEIAVASKSAATGLTMLNIGTTPDNDAFASPVVLNGVSTRVTASNAHCSLESGEPRTLGFAGGTSLWYRWTAPRSGQFQLAAISNDFDPTLAIYTGGALNTLTLVIAGDNSGVGNAQTGSLCTLAATAGTTYVIKLDAKSAATIGQFTLTLTDSLWQGVAGSAITGSPAIAPDGTIYVGSTDNSLYAFAADGTLKPGFPVATGGLIDTSSPAIANDGTVYVGSNDGKLYAINPDGTQKWAQPHNFNPTSASAYSASNSPAIGADGTIYVKPSDGFLYALNPADGSTKWSRNVNGLASYGSAAIAPDGTIYQGSEDKVLYAINPADGSIKWRFTADAEIYTVPAIDAAGNIYFGTLTTARLYSLAPDGTRRWVYSGATTSTSSSPCLSADGRTVYFGGYDKKLHAVDTTTGQARWVYTLGDEVRASSPAVDANGVIYIGCYDFKLYAINPDGTLNRTYDTGNWLRSCPALFANRLYVGSNDGKLYAFDIGTSAAFGPWSQYRANPRRLGRAVSDAFAITAAPKSQTAIAGLPVTLSVAATGPSAISYQWSKDGTDIAGATAASYTIPAATVAAAGSYAVKVSSAQGTLTSPAAVVTVEAANPGRLTNLSVRTTAGTGAQILTIGFVVTGSPDKPVLIRAIGPSLTQFGVAGALDDPRLQLFSGSAVLTANDNWATPVGGGGSIAIANAFAQSGAFPLDPDSKDAALVRAMSPGNYTAQISSAGATGVALAELYDTAPSTGARLVNVSARAQVATGGGILIAGFSINGNLPKRILVRGIGPSLSQFSVTGRLADPKLAIFDAAQKSVASNDDWGGDTALAAAFASVGAFSLNSTFSLDAALVVTLAPGTYTAQVSGVNNATGAAIVEIYELP